MDWAKHVVSHRGFNAVSLQLVKLIALQPHLPTIRIRPKLEKWEHVARRVVGQIVHYC
jgi:hypothetical protein